MGPGKGACSPGNAGVGGIGGGLGGDGPPACVVMVGADVIAAVAVVLGIVPPPVAIVGVLQLVL